MHVYRSIRTVIAAGVMSLAIACSGAGALAADLMPLKAVPPPPPPGLDIHGFFDVSFKNDYITPRGLLVTNTGLTTQALMGLVFDLYKSRGQLSMDHAITVAFGFVVSFICRAVRVAIGSWRSSPTKCPRVES